MMYQLERRDSKPCSCLYIQVILNMCYRGKFFTHGKTDPSFSEQVSRRQADFISAGWKAEVSALPMAIYRLLSAVED